MEFEEGTSLTQSFKRRRKATQKRKETRAGMEEPSGISHDLVAAKLPDAGERFAADAQPEILASEFDYSVESHFKFVDTSTKLCGYPGTLEADQEEIKRFSNSVTFLREWRDFNYKPRVVKFACQNNSEEKDVIGGVTMSQFSAACVPKKESQNESGIGVGYSKDFIMNVGGSVWALDWCPRVDRDSKNCFKYEFVAVAAHPPDSSYHKIGAPLTGRGAIQIWCLLTAHVKDGPSQGNKKSRPNFRKKATVTSNERTKVSRPRGRPRKEPLPKSVESIDAGNEHAQPLDIENPRHSPEFNSSDRTSAKVSMPRGRPRKEPLPKSVETIDAGNEHAQPLAIENPRHSPEFNSSDRTSAKVSRPRGRPRKEPLPKSVETIDAGNEHAQPLAIENPVHSLEFNSSDRTSAKVSRPRGRPRKVSRPRGRPRKEPLPKSVEMLDAGNEHAQPLAIEYAGHSLEFNSSDRTSAKVSKPRKEHLPKSVEMIDAGNEHVQPLAIENPGHSLEFSSSDMTSAKVLRPRARPGKKPLPKPVEMIDAGNVHTQPLAIENPGHSPEFNSSDRTSAKVSRPRGRPRKEPLPKSVEMIDAGNEHAQALAIENPRHSPELNSSDRISGNSYKHINDENCVRMDGDSNSTEHANALLLTSPDSGINKPKAGKDVKIHNGLPFLRQCEHGESALEPPISSGSSLYSTSSDENITCISSAEDNSTKSSIPVDVALPRMILCLAHNGKVAWDVKWRPVDAYHPDSMYMMGFLAVLLGNGALEVWKVPLPHTVKLAYPASEECIDPRFIKLQPVFRCSMLKCGDKRSIPLTVEWSVSSPHDLILAGCHDGVVALWKFSASDSLAETRPLLSFSADTGPIRTLAWAPNQSDIASANIIVTAGQKGSKFWDIRDPFRPLWDHPIPVVTFSLDWLPNPRCVFGSTEDGTMWLLNLEKAAHDLPFSEKCHYMASKHGFHNFDCSAFSLWSLQASRLTGMVAYCGEDGSTRCFQPTTRLLKDPSRNRVHHYLCGSLLEEGDAIIVATPFPNSPFQVKFPSMKRTVAVKERAKQRLLGGTENAEEKREERDEQFEVFPAKVLTMHRVRWNVNKGSEKWLCYGGAAGLLRCQEVDFSKII